jgi:hypothetical protein
VKYVRSFVRFWWNFIVGDDWRVAAGLAVVLGLTVFLVHRDVNAWWLVPLGVAVVLVGSLARETGRS